MAKPGVPKLTREAIAAIEQHGSQVAAARALGISRGALQDRLRADPEYTPGRSGVPAGSAPKAAKAEPEPPTADERRDLLRLRAEVARLRRERDESDGAAVLASVIAEARGRLQSEAVPEPTWAATGKQIGDAPGVPMLMLTDWHIGETVRPSEVYGQNVFNAEVSAQRVRQCVDRAIMLGGMHAPPGGHKGGVVFLGGDFVSGWLHEELMRSDWCSPLQSAAWAVSHLVWALRALRDAWGKLYVVGVPGNHGRLTHRPPGKGHAFQSFDWLIYTMLADRLGDNAQDRKTITVSVPDDGEQIVQVAGTRYMLMHGHQLGVKGGDGIIGAIGPITRGATKVGRAQRSVGRDFDVLVIGHYHTTLWLPNVIVGGTLKGFDEYARVSRFTYEPASQLLWFSHPRWGPNSPMRVFLQDPPKREAVPFVALEPAQC